jgi:predicted small secreted protein
MKLTIKLALLTLVLAGTILQTGCNTARGFGRDVERTGETIQRETR